MYGLDYEPRNAKEEWLLRIVYWGTILLVAFFFWEYVKAKYRQLTKSGDYTHDPLGRSSVTPVFGPEVKASVIWGRFLQGPIDPELRT